MSLLICADATADLHGCQVLSDWYQYHRVLVDCRVCVCTAYGNTVTDTQSHLVVTAEMCGCHVLVSDVSLVVL